MLQYRIRPELELLLPLFGYSADKFHEKTNISLNTNDEEERRRNYGILAQAIMAENARTQRDADTEMERNAHTHTQLPFLKLDVRGCVSWCDSMSPEGGLLSCLKILQQVLHCDVSARNFLVDPINYRVVISDFGMSRPFDGLSYCLQEL